MSLVIAPIEVVTDNRLTGSERLVLLALYSFRGKDTNSVFPSLEALSERSRINDKTRISKITTSLKDKGWLEKGRRGFSNRVIYSLTIPDVIKAYPADNEDLESASDVAEMTCTELAETTNTKLDKMTNTKLDKNTISNKQTIEQTTEHSYVEPDDSTQGDLEPDHIKKNTPPPCPHMKIIEVYHRVLPECQGVVPSLWSGSQRAKDLAKRWAERPEHQSLAFWEGFFHEIRGLDNGFYLGMGQRGWVVNLGWMLKPKNFTTLIEKIIDKETRHGH